MAEFRIDQATPGAGTPGQSRLDLIAGEEITLVATSPGGASYTWEVIDKINSTAALSATSGTTVTLGVGGSSIVAPCAFLIELVADLAGVVTRTKRIVAVRGSITGLRPLVFSESALASDTYDQNDPDNSTDNALYADLAGLGVAASNWRGWVEWAWELLKYLEANPTGGGIFFTSVKTSLYTAVADEFVLYDASGGTFQLNAPSGPSANDRFGLKEIANDGTGVTISGNGSNIQDPGGGLVASFFWSGPLDALTYQYTGSAWVLV